MDMMWPTTCKLFVTVNLKAAVFVLPLQEASGVLAEVAELTSQNQAFNKTFMALAGAQQQQQGAAGGSRAPQYCQWQRKDARLAQLRNPSACAS